MNSRAKPFRAIIGINSDMALKRNDLIKKKPHKFNIQALNITEKSKQHPSQLWWNQKHKPVVDLWKKCYKPFIEMIRQTCDR